MEENRERIIAAAEERILTFGTRGVRVDDIAADLGMSKKTLYRYFSKKSSLLDAVFLRIQTRLTDALDGLITDLEGGESFVTTVRGIVTTLFGFFTSVKRPFLVEMNKVFGQPASPFNQIRESIISRYFMRIMTIGQQRGFVRSDIDRSLVVQLFAYFTGSMYLLPSSGIVYSFKDIFEGVVKIFYTGILTGEGRSSFDETDLFSTSGR